MSLRWLFVVQDLVQPLILHYCFRIPYIEDKSKVGGSQDGGRDRNPRLSDLGRFAEFWVRRVGTWVNGTVAMIEDPCLGKLLRRIVEWFGLEGTL